MRLYLDDGKIDVAPLISSARLKALYEPRVYVGKSQFAEIGESHYGLGLAMLVDEARLDWTKPVRDYLPEFRLHDAVATERVTAIDLLCHNTGLPGHDWLWMPADISR